MTKLNLTFDRKSVRTYDNAGRLHVSDTPISKACVSPYYGYEIPGSEALGLDPDRIYNMLRPAEELAKAASSFDGLPLLLLHAPTSADNHPYEQVAGSVGTGTKFDGLYLRAALSIWTEEAIAGVESGELRELSSSYSYDADMTPGELDGVPYDGKMVNINGNHVAIVPRGRVGPDVLVSDSAINITTTEGAPKMPNLVELLTELGLSEENVARVLDLVKPDEVEAEDEEEEKEDPIEEKKEEKVQAADAAIQIKLATDALRAEFRALEQAKQAVRGAVGDVIGMDSATDVYQFALKQLGVDFKGMPPEGLPLLYKVASSKSNVQTTIRTASDAETVKQFPGLSRFNKGY